jgi:hypothetical protein
MSYGSYENQESICTDELAPAIHITVMYMP